MRKNSLNVLFLYARLSGYFVACLNYAIKEIEELEVYIVRWPVADEAPFKFELSERIHLIDRNAKTDSEFFLKIEEIKPKAIFSSGWNDKLYNKIALHYRAIVPTVLLMDNQWHGTLKQKIGFFPLRYFLSKRFKYAWVSGEPQKKYALKLGFENDNILKGLYVADKDNFSPLYNEFLKPKTSSYPKRFLYVGRYVEHKGVRDLWEGYKQYKKGGGSWELWCAGTGNLWESRTISNGIKHFGFVQPEDMGDLIKETGFYILPSHFEPWGVSVHEMAASGLPLLLSDKVGCKSEFLSPDENGFEFSAHSANEICRIFHKIEKLTHKECLEMSRQSNILSKQITQENWLNSLHEIID